MPLDHFVVKNDSHCLCSDVDRGADIFMGGLGRHSKTLTENFETEVAANQADEAHATLGWLIKRHRRRCRPAWKAKLDGGLRTTIAILVPAAVPNGAPPPVTLDAWGSLQDERPRLQGLSPGPWVRLSREPGGQRSETANVLLSGANSPARC